MEKIEKFLFKYPFILILLLSIPAFAALLVKGFYGASDDLHIAWLYEMNRAISGGQFPPRFVPDLSFGYGYPLFNFVFPLPFYLGEIFHKLGLTLVDSIKAVFLVSLPLSGYFMFKFLKKYAGSWISLAGAILYVYTPYRATDIYVRGAIGESLAFVFVPMVAWGITSGNIGILALSVAGLLLSHNIMAYMFIPFLIIFAIITGLNKKVVKGFVLGLAVSIYFWLPAIVESNLMKYDTVFNFIDHHPTIMQLITPYFGYGASVAGPYDGMSFFMGLINLLLIVFAVVFRKKLTKVTYWALGMIAVSVFMMNYRSTFVWNIVPFLPYFQFPWRFLSLTTFATSILVLIFDKFKYSKVVAIAIIILAIVINFKSFRPQDFLGRMDDYFINRYIPVPVVSEEYLKTGEEYLRLPKATVARPTEISPDTEMAKSFEVDLLGDVVFDYHKYYFLGWEAKVDGKNVEVWAGSPYGQVQFNIPSGKHNVEIAFKETPFRMILDVVSLLALVLAVTITLRKPK